MIAQLSWEYIKTRPTRVFGRLISYVLFEGRPVTTRGQWINPLVFGLFGIYKRLPQMKKVHKPIFILGSGRSGTTILGILLSMHRDVGYLNEPKALWHTIYPDEDVIGSYSNKPAKYRLAAQDVSEDTRQTAHRLLGAQLRVTRSTRIIDKYPELIFRTPFVLEIFPDAKFIFLVRNGWDTCASIENWSQTHGEKKNEATHDWWGVNQRKWKLMQQQLVASDPLFDGLHEVVSQLTKHTDMAVVEWIITMREGLRRIQEHPSAVCLIRYESLTSNPEIELKKLLGFVDLRHDKVFLDFSVATLHSAPVHPPFEMHPALLPLFKKTMQELGYSS
jgi:hypothetical protein